MKACLLKLITNTVLTYLSSNRAGILGHTARGFWATYFFTRFYFIKYKTKI